MFVNLCELHNGELHNGELHNSDLHNHEMKETLMLKQRSMLLGLILVFALVFAACAPSGGGAAPAATEAPAAATVAPAATEAPADAEERPDITAKSSNPPSR